MLWTVLFMAMIYYLLLLLLVIITFYRKWGNSQPSWLLHEAARTDAGDVHAHGGTKHSIMASDITAVSSAVSACAINSVAERVDCLCKEIFNS